jgi:hypothetical protein
MAIEDWYRKYPRDPWLPGFTNRLIRVYDRAHTADAHWARARGIARSVGR